MSVVMVDHDGGSRFCTYADPAIKLFGRDIPLTQEALEDPSLVPTVQVPSHQGDQPDQGPHVKECKEPMDIVPCKSESLACIETGSRVTCSSAIMLGDNQVMNAVAVHSTVPKAEEAQGPLVPEKMPKKPDKLLPCPRCHSLDTKFCYFNNYNVNQPRHFCRKCQRYWTAGGTLRNVPVGAGRRKNKHSASHHQKHSIVSDSTSIRTGAADMARHRFPGSSTTAGASPNNLSKPRLRVLPIEAQPVPSLDSPSPSANVNRLHFGQESPLCRSLAATTLGIQENGAGHNHGRPIVDGTVAADVKFNLGSDDRPEPDACTSPAKMLPSSCPTSGPLGNAVGAGGVKLQEGELTVNAAGGKYEMQVGEGAPPIHGAVWQPGSNMVSKSPFSPTTHPSLDSEISSTAAPSLPPPNVLACNGSPGSFWPGFAWPFMNPAIWGAPPFSPYSMPVYPPGVAAAAAAAALLPYSGAGGAPQNHQPSERSQPEKCLWVPKTLRIDDPLNAARSSIWTTLGLGDGPLSSPAHGSTRAFQAKDAKDDNEAVSMNRCSNPAAFSRSAAFQENS